jgi:tetraacyldisaccharide 4'-kinase
MREPHFWRVTDKRSRASAPMTKFLLTPAALVYAWAGKRRLKRTTPVEIGIPVICVGNLTMGGAGKTPVTAAVRKYLVNKGFRAASLSRGYGGAEEGPLKVDVAKHTAKDVGDEPLMLAGSGEAWISKNRLAGARAMVRDGVHAIVMDDGHQNPSLKKTISLVVIDASLPFGNRHVFPKGPLREPIALGLSRADAVILMGEGEPPPELKSFHKPVLRAKLAPVGKLVPGRYIAFAGIGRPERFFDALQKLPGVELAEAVPYPDHHMFEKADLDYLMKLVTERGARLITTDKDYVRLPASMKQTVLRASVEAKFDDEAAFSTLFSRIAP